MRRETALGFLALLGSGCSPFAWPKAKDTNAVSTGNVATLSPLYASATAWNDYIKWDNPSANGIFNSSGTACSGSEFGGYNTCLHAGMMRQVSYPQGSTCAGVTAADTLGVFVWRCDDSVTPVRVVNVGFQPGKGLSSLIDFDALAWREIGVTISGNPGVGISASRWYSNPIVEVTGSATLSVAGAVYVVRNSVAALLVSATDRVALVVKPGAVLSGTGSVNRIVQFLHNFAWFEGVIDGLGQETGILCSNGGFCVIRNSSIVNINNSTFPTGVNLSTHRNARVDSVSLHNFDNIVVPANGTIGLQSVFGGGHLVTNFKMTNKNTDGAACYLYDTKNVTIIGALTASQQGYGCGHADQNNAGHVLINVTFALGTTYGGANFNTANNFYMNLAVAGTVNHGFLIGLGGVSTQNHSLINLGIAHTGQNGIYLENTTRNYFSGLVRIGNTTALPCGVSGGTFPGLIDTTCANQGASSATYAPGANFVSSFVGKVIADDTANTSDSNGSAIYSTGLDWTNFENRYRGWGRDGTDITDPTARAACTSATCRVWDWSLSAADTMLRNAVSIPDGNTNAVHLWSVAGQTECNNIKGAAWQAQVCSIPGYITAPTCTAASGTWSTGLCSTTLLRNAVEILEDGIGNENGLCESNETCLYTPNIGAYQGHGNLTCVRGSQSGCAAAFSDGTLTGVTLMQYQNNGY